MERYLTAKVPVAEQDLALAFAAVRELPTAKELLRRRVVKGRVGDRAYALRLIGDDAAAEFADLVLEVWLSDKSPTVHYAALDAIGGFGSALRLPLQARITRTCEALRVAVSVLVTSLQPGQVTSDTGSGARLTAVMDTVGCLENLWVAALLSASDTPEMADELLCTYRSLAPQLVGAGSGLSGQLQVDLFAHGERLIQDQLGVLRHLCVNGRAWARMCVLELLGLPVVALSPEAPNLPHTLKQKLSWGDFFGELSRCCEELVSGWWYLNWGFPEGVEGVNRPFAGLTLIRQRIAQLITTCEVAGHEMLPAVLSALEQSREAEREARAKAERELGYAHLTGTQEEFDEQPLVFLSLGKMALADFVRSHEHPRGEIPAYVRVAGPMLAEQIFQIVLLNVAAANLSPRATATLIQYTESNSALVVECAQTMLVRLGQKALTRLQMAVPRCAEERQRAHLLEVCRCIGAAGTLTLAREYITSRDPLVAAVCLRTLEQAGTPADAPAVISALRTGDELVMVSALRALGRLAADQSVDEFVEFLSHRSATVRYAALWGLQRCSDEVQSTAAELLSQSDDAFERIYGVALLDSTACQALCPYFQGEPIAVGGSFILGARCAVFGPLPWQWGVGDLFAEDEDLDWETVWPLIARDGELARDWIDYSLHRKLPPGLLDRLGVIAREQRDPDSSEQAQAVLLVLLRNDLEAIATAAAAYYQVSLDDVMAALPAAFAAALARFPDRALRDIVMPNPSVANPLGDGVLLEYLNDSVGFAAAFTMLLKQTLPEALHILRPRELDTANPETKSRAVLEHWAHLAQFEDALRGLWVEPLLTPADLSWYCAQPDVDSAVKYQMINYLVAGVALAPQFAEERQAQADALHQVFRPLLRHTASRVAAIHRAQTNGIDAVPIVEEAYWAAIEEFDGLKYWSAGSFLPLGTLSDMGRSPGASTDGYHSKRPHVPFPLFLQKRMEALVRSERSKARRTARQGNAVADKVLEVQTATDASERWRLQEAAVIDALDKATAVDHARLSLAQVDTGWLQTQTKNLVIDGEMVPCVDMETLGAILGKKPEALRQRHHRGRLKCILHEGLLYYPTAGIPEELAASLSDAKLGELLGVHRNTVGALRREAPAGLSAVEMAQYLRHHVKRE
ncbi:MAG: HEAT repeat domain-containing protein [Armatimonadota bacterium]